MKIVFVCTGNASRSAVAEVILKKMIADAGIMGVEVGSCGTKVPDGLCREDVMCRIAAESGYRMGGKAIPMSEELLNSANLIIVMTEHHRKEVTRLLSYSHWDRIVRFNDYCFGESTDLPDPHYQTEHVYRTCFATVERGCKEIIRKLRIRASRQLQDKCRGSLVGGAVGDALGYEVEFMSLSAIRNRFGYNGISDYVPDNNGIAEFSDDTQMSLFTSEGLLTAIAHGKALEKNILPYISTAYINWYHTQCRPPISLPESWLSNLKALWACRAPGVTCMSALQAVSKADGTPVVNNSKGCGGVMRVAPIGIFSATHPGILDIEQAGYLAGQAADVTHKHPLSTYSSMALAMIVAECMAYENIDRDKFKSIVMDRVFGQMCLRFKDDKHLAELHSLVAKALELAVSDKTDACSIRELGEGWVAEETLAIAIFSVMRHIDDFGKCICSAVNHDGDSDSTGAVAGNIIGAILGYSAIPDKYIDNLELHDVLVSVADDLGGFSADEQMHARYRDHKPYGINPSFLI